jgi:hypothetical protein
MPKITVRSGGSARIADTSSISLGQLHRSDWPMSSNWQFDTKTVETNADLSEHLADFESIWAWSLSQ